MKRAVEKIEEKNIVEERGVQPKRRWRENITTERERRWRKDGVGDMEEEEG